MAVGTSMSQLVCGSQDSLVESVLSFYFYTDSRGAQTGVPRLAQSTSTSPAILLTLFFSLLIGCCLRSPSRFCFYKNCHQTSPCSVRNKSTASKCLKPCIFSVCREEQGGNVIGPWTGPALLVSVCDESGFCMSYFPMICPREECLKNVSSYASPPF